MSRKKKLHLRFARSSPPCLGLQDLITPNVNVFELGDHLCTANDNADGQRQMGIER